MAKIPRKYLQGICKIGIPTAIQGMAYCVISMVLTRMISVYGSDAVATQRVGGQIESVSWNTADGFAAALNAFVAQNYGAGKPERIWSGIKASTLMMVIYTAVTFLILMVGAKSFALIFVDPSEIEILEKTELFLHISVSFFPMLGLLCILRYTIQGVGYTNLAMFSGVSEMIARILVSIYAVPAFGFIAVCYGDPMAWIAADLFLIPAFIYVYRRLKRQVLTSAVA